VLLSFTPNNPTSTIPYLATQVTAPMHWQRRHSILAILFAAYLLCYMDRMAIATAIPYMAKDFGLSPLGMGGVLSAFFIGYAFMQLPGGILADRFGPRRIMTAAIAGWSLSTVFTGMANSLSALLAIRVLFGATEGSFPPSASKTVALWFPPEQVGRANGFQLSAVQLGAAVAPICVSWIIGQWGWRAVFYSLLVPGLVLALLVWTFIKDVPASIQHQPAVVTPIGEVLKMPAVRWCAVTIFLWSIAAWGLMNWLPTYLLQSRGFSLSKMGLLGSLPYFAGAVGYFLGGWFSDHYSDNQRRIPIAIGLLGGGVTTHLAVAAPSGEWAVVALIFSFLFVFMSAGGIFTIPLVAVPRHAVGAAFGFINTAAQVAAFLSPLAVGYVLNATHGDFTPVLYGFVGFFVVAAVAALEIRSPTIRVAST
jgi:sugar phosphate permease